MNSKEEMILGLKKAGFDENGIAETIDAFFPETGEKKYQCFICGKEYNHEWQAVYCCKTESDDE